MVVHVVRGDGIEGVSAAEMGKVRKLATSIGASLHKRGRDDVPTTLLEFAREVNATNSSSGRPGGRGGPGSSTRGSGAAIVQQSGKIDVHMVTHARPRPRHRISFLGRGERRAVSWLAAVVVRRSPPP